MSLDKEHEMSFTAANTSTAKPYCKNGLHFEKPKLLHFDIDNMLSKRKRCVPSISGSVTQDKKRRLHSNDEMDNDTDEESQDMLTCPVCMEYYSTSDYQKEPVFLKCHHTACFSCLLLIKKRPHPKCPMCRASLGNSPILQKNFYLINFMKKKRVEKNGYLVSWCNDCKGIAKEQCSAHTLQHMPESICHLAGIQNHMQTSLSGILADKTQASSHSFDVMKTADSLLSKAFLELNTLLAGIKNMHTSIAYQESIIKRQFSEIQNKMKTIKPFRGFEADAATTSWSTMQSTSTLPDNLLTKIRCYTHENQIELAHSFQDTINILTIVEQCMNTAINNKELLNSKVALIDTDAIRFAVHDKIQTFLDALEKNLAHIRDVKVQLYGEDELQAPPVKSPSFRCLTNDYENPLPAFRSKPICPIEEASTVEKPVLPLDLSSLPNSLSVDDENSLLLSD